MSAATANIADLLALSQARALDSTPGCPWPCCFTSAPVSSFHHIKALYISFSKHLLLSFSVASNNHIFRLLNPFQTAKARCMASKGKPYDSNGSSLQALRATHQWLVKRCRSTVTFLNRLFVQASIESAKSGVVISILPRDWLFR